MKIPALPLVAPVEQIVGPVPTEWAAGKVAHPSGALIILQISTPSGVQQVFLTEESAKALSGALTQLCSSILVVPAGTKLP